MASTITQPKQFVNVKANNAFAIEGKSYYAQQQVTVPFAEVVAYSTNLALVFFIAANCYASYLMAEVKGKEKYVYYGLLLYVIQIVYNFLDINSTSNLSRLEKITGVYYKYAGLHLRRLLCKQDSTCMLRSGMRYYESSEYGQRIYTREKIFLNFSLSPFIPKRGLKICLYMRV